jgi:hypothetical protein
MNYSAFLRPKDPTGRMGIALLALIVIYWMPQQQGVFMQFKQVFLEAPEDIMTPEFREFVTKTWSDELLTPSVDELAQTYAWLLKQTDAHISSDVEQVLASLAEAVVNMAGLEFEDFQRAISNFMQSE